MLLFLLAYLEHFPDFCGLFGNDEGGFFLRKNPLSSCGFGIHQSGKCYRGRPHHPQFVHSPCIAIRLCAFRIEFPTPGVQDYSFTFG